MKIKVKYYMKKIPVALAAFMLLSGVSDTALAAGPPTPEYIMDLTIAGTGAGDRSGIQLFRTRYMLEFARLREQIGKDRAMRRMQQKPEGTKPPSASVNSGAPSGSMPPNRPKPPKSETFTLHVDNAGFSDSTGMMREGVIYTNRNLSGNKDRLTMEWFRAQGFDTGALEYCLPLDKKGSSADFVFISSANNLVYGAMRARDVNGHSKAAVVTLRTPVTSTRDLRTEAGLQYFYGRMSTDMGKVFPAMGLFRKTVLDTQYHRWSPYIAVTHYTDSTVLYHKHSLVLGNESTLSFGHRHYIKYELNAFYEKDYEHGQKLKARFDGQLTNRRQMSSMERFYLGGMNSVRGYKESMLHGDEGFAASVEYSVPIEKSRHLSAFTFVDGGRIYGTAMGNSDNSTMLSTGIGLTYSNKGLNASVSLGVPLKRDIVDEKVPPTRLNFMMHWVF
ncbi:MAG: ShlB/FhaC/HecB family hemolysin secretion/activation protein [Schwartzia succinivorans]|nr:ShlB/FhaC/HecB family hemolysin secretion/activation protein [Schwartzia succinivorans]